MIYIYLVVPQVDTYRIPFVLPMITITLLCL
jgi:hypothetical protein